MKDDIKHSHIGDSLPLWHFEKDKLVFNDGSLGVGIKLKGIDISTATHEAINSFCQQLRNLLNSLEEGIRIQIFYRLSSDISDLLESHEAQASNISPETLPIVKSRMDFLRSNMQQKNFFSPEIYFFVRSKPYRFKKKGIFTKSQKFEQVFEDEFEEHEGDFNRVINQIYEHLENMQLAPTKLLSKEWFKLIFDYFNLERSEVIGHPRFTEQSDEL